MWIKAKCVVTHQKNEDLGLKSPFEVTDVTFNLRDVSMFFGDYDEEGNELTDVTFKHGGGIRIAVSIEEFETFMAPIMKQVSIHDL